MDATPYGPPDGLQGKKLPVPIGRADAASIGVGLGDDAGASPEADGGLAVAGDAGCSVGWTAQVFPNMTSTGAWRCADAVSCHGGPQSPAMSDDPGATYRVLASYTMQLAPQPLRYLVVGSTDPSQSGIHCNLSGATCGVEMPLRAGGARLPTAAELQMLDAWLACGAPYN